MTQEGFLFDELSDFREELINVANKLFPEETKKFIKNQGRNLSRLAKKIAKSEVGTAKGKKKNWVDTKSYHKKFDSSSVYNTSDGSICCKAFNNSRHAHLIEKGHMNIPRGEKRATTKEGRKQQQASRKGSKHTYTEGKYIFEKAGMQYQSVFQKNCDDFLSQYFDDIGEHS